MIPEEPWHDYRRSDETNSLRASVILAILLVLWVAASCYQHKIRDAEIKAQYVTNQIQYLNGK